MAKNILVNLTVAELKRAAAIKAKIEQLEKDLAGILGIPEALTLGGMVRQRKKIRRAARTKLASAAKVGWAKVKPNK